MAKSRPSVQKRNLESKKIDKKQAKEARRAAREAEKAEREAQAVNGVDPDLAGIVAGPQPVKQEVLDWEPTL